VALSPGFEEAAALDADEGSALARVAGCAPADRRVAASAASLLGRWGLTLLVPVHDSPRLAVVVGARTSLRARSTPVQRWNLCARAIVDAHATHAVRGEELMLIKEASIARALEDAAMSSTASAPDAALDWIVRFYAGEHEPYFLATFVLTSTRTVAIFGRAITSGASASLVNVSVKSFCDVVVRRLGTKLDGETVLRHLNRFLWQRGRPLAVYCHLVDFDITRDRVEITSAGHMRLIRVCTRAPVRAVELHRCHGEPLGASEAGRWGRVTCEITRGDGVVLINNENDVAGGDDRHARLAELLQTGDDLSAATIIGHALDAGIQAHCVLSAHVPAWAKVGHSSTLP
jgi:hypothetical protein